MIKLESINRDKFVKELKKTNINENSITLLNESLMQNFEIYVEFLKIKKIKKISLKQTRINDLLILKKFKKNIKKYFLYYIKNFKIIFEDFIDEEILMLIGERNYLNYCSLNNLKPKWNENFLKKEKNKIKQNSHLLKYETFKILIEAQKKIPFSKFNFPNEKGADRFVFYFHMYSEKQKEKILKLINNLKIKNNELKKLIEENKINKEIFYYALGFKYKNNKIERITLYTKFSGDILRENKVKEFIKKKHEIEINIQLKNVWYYAIDFFEDKNEIKIYDEPYLFNEKINNEEIDKILNNKHCIKVLKFIDKKNYLKKYEFNLKLTFNDDEKNTLKKYNLYKINKNTLAIYVKNGEILKSVIYEI